jgi:hypothetical protein
MTQIENQIRLTNHNVVAPWFLYNAQKDIYLTIGQHRFPTIECSRRFGKTVTSLVYVRERMGIEQQWVVRWCEPWKNQAREIVQPEVLKIEQLYQPALRLKYYKTDSFYEHPVTGSRLYLRGVNEDRGESARGSFSHLIICDEVGSWKEPDYIINEVLLPQLLTTKGSLVKLSTPPRDLGHKWYQYKESSIVDGSFAQKTVNDCTWIDDDEKLIIKKEIGEIAWRREMLCEPVTDPEYLVIPEFNESRHIVETVRPPHFDFYVGADFGFKDFTAIVFGYVDFIRRKLIIEDEVVVNAKNSQEISNMIRAKEVELYGDKMKPYRRVADAPIQQIYDLQNLHSLTVLPAQKDDKYSAINALRVLFNEGRIEINPRCKKTLFQIKVGIWNERRTDFERGETTGHLDSIMALVYLNRNIDWHKNPYPAIAENVHHATHYIPENLTNTEEKKLGNLFAPFVKSKRSF